MSTLDYYNQNAEEYYSGTVEANVSALYSRFEPLLPAHAKIIDIGCGSGRDSKHFIEAGYIVTAIDGSEELSRRAEKLTGINALKENGYGSVADVVAASSYNLSSIYGISEDSARRIKKKAAQFQRETSKTVKPRLSADKRDPWSTALVRAVVVYMDSKASVTNCQKLLQFEVARRKQSLDALQPMMSGISRLFMSSAKKERAEIAYTNLSRLVSGKYGQAAHLVVGKLDTVARYTDSDVWNVFRNRAAAFYAYLEEVVPGIIGNGDVFYGLPEELFQEIQDQDFFPNGLTAKLYPYQVMGVKYILHQERVLLGDEMGLGKTVQAIAAMVSLRNTGVTHFLVVCPASVAWYPYHLAKDANL